MVKIDFVMAHGFRLSIVEYGRRRGGGGEVREKGRDGGKKYHTSSASRVLLVLVCTKVSLM